MNIGGVRRPPLSGWRHSTHLQGENTWGRHFRFACRRPEVESGRVFFLPIAVLILCRVDLGKRRGKTAGIFIPNFLYLAEIVHVFTWLQLNLDSCPKGRPHWSIFLGNIEWLGYSVEWRNTHPFILSGKILCFSIKCKITFFYIKNRHIKTSYTQL